ncbi:MAG: hypothetical protein KDK51_10290, partial [Deltaproteobacteria bacterium]|nr:hypothetical protein [Deltaproteobacteria bacterium]
MKRNKLLLVGILFFSSLTHAQEYFGEDLINALAHGQDVYTFSHGFAAQTYPTADLEYDWNNCHLSTKVKLQLIEV